MPGSSPGMTSVKLARKAALVLADAGAHAADDLVHRAAGGERRSRLGKGHALLRHHALRLGRGGSAALRKLQHAQGHHRLHLVAEARGIEGELHPGREHGYRIRGVRWGECKGSDQVRDLHSPNTCNLGFSLLFRESLNRRSQWFLILENCSPAFLVRSRSSPERFFLRSIVHRALNGPTTSNRTSLIRGLRSGAGKTIQSK